MIWLNDAVNFATYDFNVKTILYPFDAFLELFLEAHHIKSVQSVDNSRTQIIRSTEYAWRVTGLAYRFEFIFTPGVLFIRIPRIQCHLQLIVYLFSVTQTDDLCKMELTLFIFSRLSKTLGARTGSSIGCMSIFLNSCVCPWSLACSPCKNCIDLFTLGKNISFMLSLLRFTFDGKLLSINTSVINVDTHKNTMSVFSFILLRVVFLT